MPTDLRTIAWLQPEILLVVVATLIYVVGAWKRGVVVWTVVALAGYAGAAALLARNEHWLAENPLLATLSGPLSVDFLGFLGRWFALAIGVLATLAIAHEARREVASEVLGTLMTVVVGMMLVARANDLVLLFVGLELVSIPSYVLLMLARPDRPSSEAAAKYFFLSILSSAMFLLGLAYLYGVSGTTVLIGNSEVPGIARRLAELPGDSPLPVAAMGTISLLMMLAGLGFKVAAVPFHFYAPDVYQGTTSGNAAVLAVAPKVAGVMGLARLALVMVPLVGSFAWQVLLVIAVLTMTIGNVCALWQTNLRRMLGYSSIAHSGYLLVGLTAGLAAASRGVESSGVAATIFYLAVYSLGTLGAFVALGYLSPEQRDVSELDHLSGLGRREPAVAGALAVAMFSLAGIPPLAGFWGKLGLVTGAIAVAMQPELSGGRLAIGFIVLSIVLVLNAAIAAAYYLRVVATMYFRPTSEPVGVERGPMSAWAALAACTLLLVSLGGAPRLLVECSTWAGQAVTGLSSEGELNEPSE